MCLRLILTPFDIFKYSLLKNNITKRQIKFEHEKLNPYLWCIELPYWFETCYFSLKMRILTHVK